MKSLPFEEGYKGYSFSGKVHGNDADIMFNPRSRQIELTSVYGKKESFTVLKNGREAVKSEPDSKFLMKVRLYVVKKFKVTRSRENDAILYNFNIE